MIMYIMYIQLCNLKMYFRQRNLPLLVLVKLLHRRKKVANVKNVERAINLNRRHTIM